MHLFNKQTRKSSFNEMKVEHNLKLFSILHAGDINFLVKTADLAMTCN